VPFDPDTLSILALVAVGLATIACVGVLLITRRQAKMRRSYTVLQGRGQGREDFIQAVQRHVEQVGELRTELAEVARHGSETRIQLSGAVQHVGVVRYDAFPDMGGRLSFSAALLDERGDGVVLSSINGRSETRTYAKPIRGGASEHNLSDEERSAIAQALGGKPSKVLR